jgi:ABC-type glycerol-3-phosphate transport system substrate-binding protein
MPDRKAVESGGRALKLSDAFTPCVTRSARFPLTRRDFLTGAGLGLAGVVAGAGCSGPSEQDRTVTLWHIWSLGPNAPIQETLDRFAVVSPEMTVTSDSVATNNIKAKLVAAAETSSLPDVFLINSAWVQELGADKHLVNLLPLAQRDGLDPGKLLRPRDYSRCCYGEAMFCLPATSANGALMLFTNHQVLGKAASAPQRTIGKWEEFTEVSAELVRKLNPGRELRIVAVDPFMGPGMVVHSALAAGIGAPTTSPDGRKSLLNSPGSLRAAHALDDYVTRVYKDYGGYRALLGWRFRFAGLHRVPVFSSLPYGRQIFALAAAGSLSSYRRLASPLQVTVQPVPGLDRLHGGMASHTWAYSISAASSKLEMAWKLVRFLTLEEDGVGRFCQAFCRPSPLAHENDAAYYQKIGPVWDSVKEVIKLDIPYSASPEDEYLRFQLFTVPMRRLRGETIESIFADFHVRYQTYLDGDLKWSQ